MIANKIFLKQSKSFWSQVKLVSMSLGYSKGENLKTYTIEEVQACLKAHNLNTDHLIDSSGKLTQEGGLLLDYFQYRAKVLKEIAEPNLMNREQAKVEFEKLYHDKIKIKLPYNKQKGEKRHYAYLTGMLNMLTEATLGHINFESDPRKQIVITKNKQPIRTLTRRVDGAYPTTTNPIAL